MRARVALEPAYILHRRLYRETSLLLEAFSQEFGRVGLVAKGARRARSRWRGALEPFQPLLLSWSGRGELATLTHVEPAERGSRLRGPALASAFYVNELVMRLVARHDPHPELFASYRLVLGALGGGERPESALRVFEKRLLGSIGYALITEREAVTGEPIVPHASYRYVPDLGPSSHHGPGEGFPVVGRVLLALESETFEDERVLGDAKRLMRFLLARHLGERPLATRALYGADW